jgi:hypothetical protein
VKKEIADLWVAALRSDKYHQVKGALRKQYGMCCLGVLCDISAQGKWMSTANNEFEFQTPAGDRKPGSLPDAVMLWSGVRSETGTLSQSRSLASYNDQGKSFEEIATVIEANYLDL